MVKIQKVGACPVLHAVTATMRELPRRISSKSARII
jgi:hypothetical protein